MCNKNKERTAVYEILVEDLNADDRNGNEYSEVGT